MPYRTGQDGDALAYVVFWIFVAFSIAMIGLGIVKLSLYLFSLL
jgi:hypothetical protein